MGEVSKGEVIGQCIHKSGIVIIEATTKEEGISVQLGSKTDSVAFYAVGRALGIRMQMAGITNCSYPFLPEYVLINSHTHCVPI